MTLQVPRPSACIACIICLLFLVVLLYLSTISGTSALCCKNCVNFAAMSQTDSISVLPPHWLSPPYFCQRILLQFFFLHCLTADVNTWVVQRVEGGWRNPGVGDEGEKWQGFGEGGITQWAGSPAGGGFDGYLNRPAHRLRVWRSNGPEVGCHSVRRWYVVGVGLLGEGRGGCEGAEPAREVRGWATGWTTQKHTCTYKHTRCHRLTSPWATEQEPSPLTAFFFFSPPHLFISTPPPLTGCPLPHATKTGSGLLMPSSH